MIAAVVAVAAAQYNYQPAAPSGPSSSYGVPSQNGNGNGVSNGNANGNGNGFGNGNANGNGFAPEPATEAPQPQQRAPQVYRHMYVRYMSERVLTLKFGLRDA